MKKALLLICCTWLSCQYVAAQVFTVDTLIYNGNSSNRVNLLIMGDGYTAAQMGQFRTNSLTVANYLLNTPPFNQYKRFFNVFAIEVVSAQSGIDHSGVSSDNACGSQPVLTVNNYLQSAFDGGGTGGGTHRCIYSDQLGLIYSIANTNFPGYDYINVLSNSTFYGGCAGGVTFTSVNASSSEIFVHEFGHSFGDLSDEYEYGETNCNVGTTQYINVSQRTDTSQLAWKKWLTTAPIPTPNGTNCSLIGLYPGAQYCSTNWYRPKCNCKMKELSQPFCEVCKEQFIFRISEMVNYIENHSPESLTPTICRNNTQLFSVDVLNSLNNTVRTQWFVDNNLVVNNGLSFTFDPVLYTNGAHQVKVVTYDTTAIARKALIPHQLIWNINLSPILTLNTIKTNVTCNGGTNGTATVIPSGGNAPYTYAWSNGATTATASNLTAGTYNVTVTSDPGMPATALPSCTPSTTGYCCNMGIYNVKFNTINNSTGNASEGYKNFDTVRTSVDTGQTYALTITTGPDYSENVRVWIDYNNNGSFENTELVLASRNTLPTRTHTGNVTIPPTASFGPLRMRVGSDWASNGYPQPCSNVPYGQYEDYTVYVRGTRGCTQTASVTITQPDTLRALITTSGSATFCQGDSVRLTANLASSYLWNTGATTRSILVTAAGNYSVTITDTSGCTATSSIKQVVVNALPSATITPNHNTIFCLGDSVILAASAGATFLWNNNATTQSIAVLNAGNYFVKVTDGNGCSATSSSITTVTETFPVAQITPSGSTTFCQGDSVILTASGNGSILWSTGATTSSITVRNSNNYFVSVSNSCGIDTAEITVVVNPLPTPSITANSSTTFCNGNTVTLTASAGSSYLWSNGATTQSITVSVSGNYSVTITDGNGCSATSAVTTVTVNPLPIATITPNGITTFCNGNTVTLTSSVGSSYLWSNGATTQSITVSASGNYSVTVTDGNGCSATSAVTTVTVNPLPIATITPNGATTFCSGNAVTLNASAGSSYLWNNAATTQSITVSVSGNYSVTVTDGNGCSATSAVTTVMVNTPQNGLPIILNDDTLLSPYTQNEWHYVGFPTVLGNNSTYICQQPGNYYVSGADINGCTSVSDTLFVNCSITGVHSSQPGSTDVKLFPNPTSGYATLSYTLSKQESVSIKMFDAIGNVVQYLLDNQTQSGTHSTIIETTKLSNGIYFIDVTIGEETISKKLVLIK